jgi:ferredoxin
MSFMVKYKVEIDLKVCISTGACYATDKLHFALGQHQQARVIGGTIDEAKSTNEFNDDQLASAQEAAKSCPVSAITVTPM